jgi:hypothetical protein
MELDELKKEYEPLGKKYGLPVFSELNNVFEIEKIERESEHLLKIVRKVMMEKIVQSLQFLEMLLNPMNAPRMYIPFVKSVTESDKKVLNDIYGKFAKLSIASLRLELDQGEEKEAELIKECFEVWKDTSGDFAGIIDKIGNPVEFQKKDKGYFG